MPNVAPHLKNLRETPKEVPSADVGRRVVVLVGRGEGPKVAFRANKVCARISGLVEGGKLTLQIDDTEYVFVENGRHAILGGEFAKATSENSKTVICELLIGGS